MKLVQTAHFGHQIGAGAQVKMVDVGEHQGGVQLVQLRRGEGFHCGLRADRGENGSVRSGRAGV